MSLVDEWREALDSDMLVGSALLDFSKAFDMVDHPILFQKLTWYGVGGEELKWFKGYLGGRRQRVCVRDALTATQNAKQEVKRQAEMNDPGEKGNAPVSTSPEVCGEGGSTLPG